MDTKNNNIKTIINCTIVTMDDRDAWYPNGYMTIENNKIKALGDMASCTPVGHVYDMSNMLVLPGFINTHTHTPSPLFRSMADDLKLMDWLQTLIWPAEKHLTEEAVYWGTSLSCLEFLQNGITTFADQYFFAKAVGRAVEASGLRAVVGATVFSDASPETEDTLQAADDFISIYIGHEEKTRIHPAIGPHAPYSCSDTTLKEAGKMASHYDILVHTHISETREENQKILELTGYSPTRYLESLGLLDNRVLAAHCVHLDDEDCRIMAEKNTRVSYNPVSNLKLVSGIMPLKRLWGNNVIVSMGTDGAQSNNSLDLLRDLKTGVLMQKQFEDDPTFFTAREALRMITIDGARALDLAHQIGSIEVGKKADLTMLNLSNANMQPAYPELLKNLYSLVVYSAMGKNVSHVMVDGEFLLYNGETIMVDSQQVLDKAKHTAADLMKKANLL